MTGYPRPPFSRRPVVKWAVVALSVAAMLVAPLCIPTWSLLSVAILVWFELLFGVLLIALLAPRTLRWSGRLAAAVVVMGTAPLFCYAVWKRLEAGMPTSIGDLSKWTDLVGMLAIILVCGVYAWTGMDVRPNR